jgi:hypothetical protein
MIEPERTHGPSDAMYMTRLCDMLSDSSIVMSDASLEIVYQRWGNELRVLLYRADSTIDLLPLLLANGFVNNRSAVSALDLICNALAAG